MNKLVQKSTKGNSITTSRIIANIFGKNHKDVLKDIRNLSCSEEFRERNFAPSSFITFQNKTLPMYILTKDGFTFLAMGYNGKSAGIFKEKFIFAFNEMEKQIRDFNPENLSKLDILKMAIESEQKREALEKENKILKPKAEFHDLVTRSDDLINMGQVSKVLQLPYGRNTLYKTLRETGVFFKNKNEPKQQYVDRGYFKMKEIPIETNHGVIINLQTLVTQKGLTWLSDKLNSNATIQIASLDK